MSRATITTSRRRVSRRLIAVPLPTVALVALLAAAGLSLLYIGRHITFTADDWIWIQYRRSGGFSSYLQPHYDHFSLFPLAVYRLFFALFGMRHYTPYRAADVALHLVCGTLLYVLVRRRLGPWLALVPTALLLFMGTAAQDLLWGFQIGFLGSVAGGLGALVLIENRRSDVMAALLLSWAIASSGVGLAFLVACFVALLARRDPWLRLWVVAVPSLVFVIWYITYGHTEPITTVALLDVPSFVAQEASAVAAGMAGLDASFRPAPISPWGPALLVGALVACSMAWRRRGGGAPTPMLLAAGAGGLTFWVLTAVERSGSGQPGASRYLYIGAVFVWLIFAEVRLDSGLSRSWLALSGLLVLGALIGNLNFLRSGEIGLREDSDNVRASLTATEVAAPIVKPNFVPWAGAATEIKAGPYLAAERQLGSPAFTASELLHRPFSLEQQADRVLGAGERLRLTLGGGRACAAAPLATAAATVGPGARLELRNSGSTRTKLYLRRFASAFTPPAFAQLPPRSSGSISFPFDRAPTLAWHVTARPIRHVGVCVAGT